MLKLFLILSVVGILLAPAMIYAQEVSLDPPEPRSFDDGDNRSEDPGATLPREQPRDEDDGSEDPGTGDDDSGTGLPGQQPDDSQTDLMCSEGQELVESCVDSEVASSANDADCVVYVTEEEIIFNCTNDEIDITDTEFCLNNPSICDAESYLQDMIDETSDVMTTAMVIAIAALAAGITSFGVVVVNALKK